VPEKPVLYIVGMPIGNPGDISIRALEILKSADLIFCETRKETARFFKKHEIPFPKDSWFEINEHTKSNEIDDAFKLLMKVSSAVLISDSGMPVICDPGSELIRRARKSDISLKIIPGPTALTTALALCGLSTNQGFHFLGFPPRQTEKRGRFLAQAAKNPLPVVLYETPYRLKKILSEIQKFIPKQKQIFIGIDLTSDSEYVFDGNIQELSSIISTVPPGAPVIILY